MSVDPSERLKWLMVGANRGNAVAQLSLGLAYARGQGVEIDYVEAYRWLELSAQGNHADATLIRDALVKKMQPSEKAKAQALVEEWLSEKKPSQKLK